MGMLTIESNPSAHYLLWSTPQPNLSSMFFYVSNHIQQRNYYLGLFMSKAGAWWWYWWFDPTRSLLWTTAPLSTLLSPQCVSVLYASTRGSCFQDQESRIKDQGSKLKDKKHICLIVASCWHKIHLLIGGCCQGSCDIQGVFGKNCTLQRHECCNFGHIFCVSVLCVNI